MRIFSAAMLLICMLAGLHGCGQPAEVAPAGESAKQSWQVLTARGEFVSLEETLLNAPFSTEILELSPEGSMVEAGAEIAKLSPGDRSERLLSLSADLEQYSLTVERDRKLLQMIGEYEASNSKIAELEYTAKQIEYDRAVGGRDWTKLTELTESAVADKVRMKMLHLQLTAAAKMAGRGFVSQQELVDSERDLAVSTLEASLTARLIPFVENHADSHKVFDAEEALAKSRFSYELATFTVIKNVADYEFSLNEAIRKQAETASTVAELEQQIASLSIYAHRGGLLIYGDTYDGAEMIKTRIGAQAYAGISFLRIVDMSSCGMSFATDQRDVVAAASSSRFCFRADAFPERLLVGFEPQRVPVALDIPQARPDGRTQVAFKVPVASYTAGLMPGLSGTIYCFDFVAEHLARFAGNRQARLVRRPFKRIMSVTGDVKTASAAFIVSAIEGKLNRLEEEGRSVEAGTVIAEVDCEEISQSARDSEIELNKKKEEQQLQIQKSALEDERLSRAQQVRAGALEVARLKHAALLKSRDEDVIISLQRSLELLDARIALAEEKISHVSVLLKKGLSSELELMKAETELAVIKKDRAITKDKLDYEDSGPTRRSIMLSELDVRKAELELHRAKLEAGMTGFRNLMNLKLLEAEIRKLDMTLGNLRREVDSASVKAPVAGVLIYNELNKQGGGGVGKARVGDTVYERIPFMQIADLRNLQVHAKVSEMDVKFIKP
ncbi:MAG: HlyD family secretion protein, partial [Candidatus Riflebacteria bacterium]|nr:HlyD family secretion protein [Candidatus Riflebacteria bacterium]